MHDLVWQNLRYVLIAGGTYGVAKGWLSADQVGPGVELATQAISGVVAAGAWAWGIYVKWDTATVPAKTAMRADVPTVNTATGAKIPGAEG